MRPVSRRAIVLAAWVAAASAAAAVAGESFEPLSGSGDVARSALDARALQAGRLEAPVDWSAFGLPENAAPPAHAFEGRLRLFGDGRAAHRVLRDPYGRERERPIWRLPAVELELVQVGSHLAPRRRTLIYTGHPRWNLLFGRGRVWQERGDGDWTRAALPFALVERNQNCTHNGVVTFLFDAERVSPAAFQVTQETCFYFQFDLWGTTRARYEPGPLAGAGELRAQLRTELERRLPTRPLAALAERAPTIDVSAFGRGLHAEHLTIYGVAAGGVHYRGPATTRTGEYPFPESLFVPSYSTAKTAFAAVALMRASARSGEAIGKLGLGELLEKAPDDWRDVTLQHLLDMTSGHYRSPEDLADEHDQRTEVDFFLAEGAAQKLRAALSLKRREAPGQRWVYHTTDTFLLCHALGRWVRGAGLAPGLVELVRDDVYRPLGLAPSAYDAIRTGNAPSGEPFCGFGLFWTPEDLVRLSWFLNRDRGRIEGIQVLDPALLAAALQLDPDDRGAEAVYRGVPVRYHHGFWARRVEVKDLDGTERTIWVPHLIGYGGIAVLLVPNGVTYYYVGDNNEHGWIAAVREAWKLGSAASLPDR